MPAPQTNIEKKFKYLNYWPLPYVGVSILNSFESCPVSFYYRYYHDIVFPPSDKMLFGTVFQDALTEKYKGKEYLPIINGSELTKGEKVKALNLLDKSNEFKDVLHYDEYMFTDLGIGIPIRFAADLVTKHEIVENKTTTGFYHGGMINEQKQGSLYHACIKKLLGLDLPIKYQIFNKTKLDCELITLNKTDEDSKLVIDWMREILSRIEVCYNSGNWITKTHGKFSCNLGKACPILNSYV